MPHTLRIEVTGDHNPDAVPINGQYPIAIIRKRLAADEVYPLNVRYNPDTDQVEYSPDGGATWEPNPSGDPRLVSPLPPQTGDNAACNSAASFVRYMAKWREVLQSIATPGITVTGVAYGMLGYLADLTGPWAVLFEFIVAAATTLATAGLSAIDAALDVGNLDTLECIVYCHLNADNQLDAAALSQVQGDVTDQIGGTDATIINLLMTVMGYGGINSAMALKLDTDDCSGCGCNPCPTPFGSMGDDNFEVTHNAGGWTGNPDGSPGAWTGTNFSTTAWPVAPSAAISRFGTEGYVNAITVYVRACQNVSIAVATRVAGSATWSPATQTQTANGCAVSGGHTFTAPAGTCADQIDVTISTPSVGNGAISRVTIS